MPVVDHAPRAATATINIAGEMTFIRIVGEGPVVYLFDEHHTTEACIQGNIANAHAIRVSVRPTAFLTAVV